jgi:hypothetical protein
LASHDTQRAIAGRTAGSTSWTRLVCFRLRLPRPACAVGSSSSCSVPSSFAATTFPCAPMPSLGTSFVAVGVCLRSVQDSQCARRCRWGHDPTNTDVLRAHNGEVREATKYLLDVVIPRFARRLERFFKLVYAPLTEQQYVQSVDVACEHGLEHSLTAPHIGTYAHTHAHTQDVATGR